MCNVMQRNVMVDLLINKIYQQMFWEFLLACQALCIHVMYVFRTHQLPLAYIFVPVHIVFYHLLSSKTVGKKHQQQRSKTNNKYIHIYKMYITTSTFKCKTKMYAIHACSKSWSAAYPTTAV